MGKYEVIQDYGTHSYHITVEKSELFCVNCGNRTVWVELGEGDYYIGADHHCITCDHTFTVPTLANNYEYDLQVIKQIKNKEKANQLIDKSKKPNN